MSRIILDLSGPLLPGCISWPLKILGMIVLLFLLHTCMGTGFFLTVVILSVIGIVLQHYWEKHWKV